MATNSSSVRFNIIFANKTIVGTKASFDKAGKGFGPIYEELAHKMAQHPDFALVVIEPKKPAKTKQTYEGMDVKFMLDYAAAVGEADFRTAMVKVRDFTKEMGGSVYPIVKRMFLEHYAPEANRRFAYAAAKAIVGEYRYKGIITAATTHSVPVEEDNAPVLSAAANF